MAIVGVGRLAGWRWSVWLAVFALNVVGADVSLADAPRSSAEIRDRAVDELRQALKTETRWVKVHAAEHLLSLGYADGVHSVFSQENELHGAEPMYRVGIWRVLAQTPISEGERERWLNRIWEAFWDEDGEDRIHAAETLAKLGQRLDAPPGRPRHRPPGAPG